MYTERKLYVSAVSDKHTVMTLTLIVAVVCLVAVDSAVRGVIVVCQQPGTESGVVGPSREGAGYPPSQRSPLL